MGNIAAYDAIADWYAEYIDGSASVFTERVHRMLRELLPHGNAQTCVDICCGTGAHARVLTELGWSPIGVDLSSGQLRHAAAKLPVACADAAALPIASGSVAAATCILAHTDVPDYAAVVAEAARILRPGGTLVHIGVHPSFTGAFADRSDPARVIVDGSYHRRDRRFDSFTDQGVRDKVGAWHTPLPDLLHTALDSGLTLTRVVEAGSPDAVPDIFGFTARASLA
ncbi:class I SAM-dependent methyltransferase [Allorhizocola rhizosphaerae]|uniref:class I SAM-dependent methyltransferase n=1 Tax=Allorhizocola rhizosphaerae TaxID=1872709 RepID=UPI000E3EA331|nr:class I SAM-dependent methyltransferase [Allorhizocola rhizosphaerae]